MGADISAANNNGMTELHLAAEAGDAAYVAVVELLVRLGADIAATNNQGDTAADVAAWCEHVSIEELLCIPIQVDYCSGDPTAGHLDTRVTRYR